MYSEFRIRSNRDFFEVPIHKVIYDLQLIAGGNELVLDDSIGLNKEEIQVRNKAQQRRECFSFKMVDIAIGEQLHFYIDPKIQCKVLDNNKVLFEDKELSLSQSALAMFHQMGYNWKSVSGTSCWTYEGETLDKRRRRFEQE